MSEGGRIGKAMMWLVIAGCAGGGYYLYKTWPVTWDGPGVSLKMPNSWKAETTPDGMKAEGPLKEEATGKAYVALHPHGQVIWPDMAYDKLNAVPTEKERIEQGPYQAVLVGYTDGPWRYRGIIVERTDVFVVYMMGCPTIAWEANKEAIEKSVRSIACTR